MPRRPGRPAPAAPASRRAVRTRLEILRGAAAAFRARGFQGTRLDDVAAACDRTKASLYYYFGSKDELLYFCQDHALDSLLGSAARAGRAAGDPAAVLEGLLTEHGRTVLDETAGGAAHLEVHALPEPWRSRIVEKRDRYEATIRRLITRGQRDGAFAAGDAGLLARLVLGGMNATAAWFRPDGPLDAATVAAESARRLVRGLRR